MRGAPGARSRLWWLRRIIPADAGSTWLLARRVLNSQDHPRGCGEHSTALRRRNGESGSSPRMRGALSGACSTTITARIIPADAGSTFLFSSDSSVSGDHPRGCGEHVSMVCRSTPPTGSSPRMRGALVDITESTGLHGIIPADAGSTPVYARHASRVWDHPRGCGEHCD